jgi:hypothetical protein
MKYSAGKEINALVRRLIREGWSFRHGGKHGRLRTPEGKAILSVPNTPSDRRAFVNFRQDVRRALG